MPDLTALADFMDDIARGTWARIAIEDRRGGRFGEVSITENAVSSLRDFAEENPSIPLEFHQLDPNKENERGLDFEIWVQLTDSRWLGYSIQAKRLNPIPPPVSYLQLSHPGGLQDPEMPESATNPRDQFQYSTLIRHAEASGSNPVHVFYNAWSPTGSAPQLGSGLLAAPPLSRELFGCSALSTYRLVELRGSGPRHNRQARFFTPSMAPWSVLFRESPVPIGSGTGDSGATGSQASRSHGNQPDAALTTPGAGIDTGIPGQAESAAQRLGHGDDRVRIAETLPAYIPQAGVERARGGMLAPGQVRPRHALVIWQG